MLLGWNPEFLRQGTAVKDSLVPDRLVYGVEGGRAAAFNPSTGAPLGVAAALDAVYEPLLRAGIPRQVCSFATAELIKSAANAYLATKVSFINAVSELCDAAGADVAELSEAMGLDPRIGNRYLHAGLGFGGGCLPKDIRSLRAQAAGHRADSLADWMQLVDSVNVGQRQRTVQLAAELCGGSVAGRTITVLGASFKPDTDDIRDSPALDVADRLAAAGAHVTVTDPKAVNNAWRRYPRLRFEATAARALEGAELVLLLTEWEEYSRLCPAVAGRTVRRRVVLDARNVLDPAAWQAEGWAVRGLGTSRELPLETLPDPSRITPPGPGAGTARPAAAGNAPAHAPRQ